MIRVGISLLVLMAAFKVSEGIQCYSCSSESAPGCGKYFIAIGIAKIECVACGKSTRNDVVIRSCGNFLGKDMCRDVDGNVDCNCHSSLCNDAISSNVCMATMVVTVVIGLASRFLL